MFMFMHMHMGEGGLCEAALREGGCEGGHQGLMAALGGRLGKEGGLREAVLREGGCEAGRQGD